MKNFVLSLAMIVIGFSSVYALESQIILINSEAYLVDLDDNYDVINVHERIPEYFQDHSSHEEILATYKQAPRHQDIGYNCRAQHSDVFNLAQVEKDYKCTQTIDYQSFISRQESYYRVNPHYWRRSEGSYGLSYSSIA